MLLLSKASNLKQIDLIELDHRFEADNDNDTNQYLFSRVFTLQKIQCQCWALKLLLTGLKMRQTRDVFILFLFCYSPAFFIRRTMKTKKRRLFRIPFLNINQHNPNICK